MKNLEGNKIAAAILIAGLIAMVSGKITDALYHPEMTVEKRGYSVAVTEDSTAPQSAAPEAEQQIDIPALMAAASAEKGAQVFKKCASCHSAEKGGPNRVGPHLYDIVEAKRASREGFAYSKAISELKGNWSYADLFKFLQKPQAFISGTKMTFAGIKDPKDIADVVAYLRQQSDNPAALPK